MSATGTRKFDSKSAAQVALPFDPDCRAIWYSQGAIDTVCRKPCSALQRADPSRGASWRSVAENASRRCCALIQANRTPTLR